MKKTKEIDEKKIDGLVTKIKGEVEKTFLFNRPMNLVNEIVDTLTRELTSIEQGYLTNKLIDIEQELAKQSHIMQMIIWHRQTNDNK